jgi:putative heme iron utilization protein
MSELSKKELSEAYQSLITSQHTLLLSTVSESGQPDISYAPYVRDQQSAFYIFTSELAQHTRNLLSTKQASVMFIQPESETNQLFARERVTFKCSVEEIASDDLIYEQQLTALQDQFGEIITVLKSLSDFHQIALKPMSGLYVRGFGNAFDINMTDGTMSQVSK